MTGFQSKRASALARLEALQESPNTSVSDQVEINRLETLNTAWLDLREQVLNQIVKDVNDGDLTAIEELLVYCDEEAMRQYLPEVDTLY
jgi:hypothetical protein